MGYLGLVERATGIGEELPGLPSFVQQNPEALAYTDFTYPVDGNLFMYSGGVWKNVHLATSGAITASFDGSTLLLGAAPGLVNHNDMLGLQGGRSGSSAEYYHLTQAQHTSIEELGAVDNSYPASGNLFMYNGSAWRNTVLATSGGLTASYDGYTLLLAAQTGVTVASGSFPLTPADGQLCYREDREILYLYSALAAAWIDTSTGGGGGGSGVHNSLIGLQGGYTDSEASEYYHLDAATYNSLQYGLNYVSKSPSTTLMNMVQPTLATVVPLTIKGAAAQTANLQEWQTSAGAAVGLIGPGGNHGIGMATAPYPLSVQGTAASDSPILGAELLVPTGWTSTGWTGSWATGWTHTPGNSSNLVSGVIFGASNYKVSYTVTGRTAGQFNMTFGGVQILSQSVSGVWGPNTTSSAAPFTVIPTSDFDGTIVLSIKQITGDSVPVAVFHDANGAAVFSIRTNNGLGANTFVGYQAGARNVGFGNTAIGYNTGARHTGGNRNTMIGGSCGYSMGSGSGNVAVGYEALYNNNFGANNIALGYGALYKNTTADGNIALGFNACYQATTGGLNVAVGQGAFQQITTGLANVGIGGSTATYLTTGQYNVFVGYQAGLTSTTQRSRSIAVGYNATVDLDDACSIGRTGTSAPLVGINTATPGAQIHVNARTDATIGAIFRRNSITHTANLTEWQSSVSAVLAAITAAGGLTTSAARITGVNSVATAAGTTVGAATDHVVVFTGVLTQTYTLPACATGRMLIIKNRSTGVVTVNRAGADTIDAVTTFELAENDSVILIGNGTDWTIN
jgi:hypothetical protein